MAKKIEVDEWIATGEFSGEEMDEENILDACGEMLDDACVHDILGQTLFKAKDGKYYTVTVEAIICEASPDFVNDIKEEKRMYEEST